MHLKKKLWIFVTIILVIIISIGTIELLSNPLRRPEEYIRGDVLKVIPVGTSMEDVILTVENCEKWEIFGKIYEHIGVTTGSRGPSTGYPLADEEVVGEKSMRIYVGQYLAYFFIETDVSFYIAFDKNSELIDIFVEKSMNVL